MNSKLLSRGVAAHAVVTVLGLVVLAACDSDRATSPLPTTKAPTAAEGAVSPTPWAYLGTGFVDSYGNKVAGVTAQVRDSAGPAFGTVTDNSPLDYEKTPGEILIKLPKPGKFKICFVSAAGFAILAQFDPCHPLIDVKPYTSISISDMLLVPAPSISWRTLDDVTQLGIGGATYTISSPRLPGVTTVVDDGKNDLSPNSGFLVAKVPAAGTYTLCQTVAPIGYYLASPACKTVTVTADANVLGGWFFNPKKPIRK